MTESNHRFPSIAKALLIGLAGFLASCGGDGGGSCDVSQVNRLVHQTMLDRYFWYQQVPDRLDYRRFDTPQETVNYLRNASLDRFSYITSQAEFESLFQNGSFIGYGFGYGIENNSRALIRFVYTQSPAFNAGMERGDEILSVNGSSTASLIASNGWGAVFGAARIGLPLSIELRRKSGLIETLQMNKAAVTINTVLHSEVINSGANTIGYLVFNSFLNTSPAEFAPVIAQFRAAGVNQLILDLRYNGGGSVEVARDLASYIKSTGSNSNHLYVELRYNDKYQGENFRYYFEPRGNSLGLNELTVITTEASCSASEQVISALQPFFTRVTTVGSRSCGKPVGQNPRNFCDLTLLAVNFAGYNADGQGEYFSGIPADCNATDDAGFAFGDPAEPMLQAARYYIDNQSCQIVPRARQMKPSRLEGLQVFHGAV